MWSGYCVKLQVTEEAEDEMDALLSAWFWMRPWVGLQMWLWRHSEWQRRLLKQHSYSVSTWSVKPGSAWNMSCWAYLWGSNLARLAVSSSQIRMFFKVSVWEGLLKMHQYRLGVVSVWSVMFAGLFMFCKLNVSGVIQLICNPLFLTLACLGNTCTR